MSDLVQSQPDDLVIVSKSALQDLAYQKDGYDRESYVVDLKDLSEMLHKATPVSGEAVEETNAFDYELLAMELAEQEHDDIHQLIFEGYPPEPSREVWQNYIYDAKNMIAMVSKYTTPQPAIPEGYALVPIEPSEKWIQKTCLRKSNTKCSTYAEWEKSHEFLHSTTVAKFRELVIADYKSMVSEAIKVE